MSRIYRLIKPGTVGSYMRKDGSFSTYGTAREWRTLKGLQKAIIRSNRDPSMMEVEYWNGEEFVRINATQFFRDAA